MVNCMEADKLNHRQSFFLEGEYFPMSVLLMVGACLCALIGAFYGALTAYLLFKLAFYRIVDAIILVSYTLLAFVPFTALVCPKWRASRKRTYLVAAVTEVLVITMFIWGYLQMLKD
jgi:hypothetical protein